MDTETLSIGLSTSPNMRDRLLTKVEQKAIRFMPCGKCGEHPPYADGSMTQKHRLKPASKGGRYTVKNTVPRCPRCHVKEPKHRPGLITISQATRRESGRKGGRASAETHRRNGWRQQGELGSKYGLRRAWELHPDLMKANASRTCRKTNHVRYHVRRGIVNPNCALCAGREHDN